MVMVLQNSAQEVEAYVKENTPEAKAEPKKEEAKGETKSEAKSEAKSEKTDEGDEIPEWVTRLGITPQQHEGITEVIKRAINRKHAQAREAEEFAAAQYNERRLAEQRAEAAEREREELRKALQPTKKESQEPKREDFESQEAYEDARVDWRADQRIKARDEEAAKQREKERAEAIMAAARERVARAIELVPDYEEVTRAADDIIPNHIAAYMQESEMFAELGYHFAKHPEDLKKLADMPARTYSDLLKVGVALEKIESKIQPFASAKAYTNGTKPSSTDGASAEHDTGIVPSQPRAAAPVIQPLNVGSNSQVEKPASRMNYDETKADWQKRNGRDLSRRSRH